MKITATDIKTTIAQLQTITVDIHIATQSAGMNSVELWYNTNYKVYTIKNRGVDYHATNRQQAIKTFYNELYRII